MRIRLVASLLLLAATSTVVIACSSDETATPGPGTTTPQAATRITAAAGGTVSDPSGKVTLNIPPGALAADTDISLAVQPSSNGSAGSVYEFGPDGLQFSKPVALEIKADPGGAVPEGKSLALAVLEGTTYKALADSKFDGTKATGSIMHFSHYSLIIVDGKLVLVPPASCIDAYAKFVPCGGNLVGTWTFTDLCISGIADDAKPGNCPTATAEGDIEITRDITIDATTLTIAAGSLKISSTINYPLSCTGVTTCAALQEQAFTSKGKPGTCVDKSTGVCACMEPAKETLQAAEVQTYTTSGNTITTKKPDGTTSTSEYCVSGDVIYSKQPDVDGKKGQLFVLKRK